jgi:hypothetical protein
MIINIHADAAYLNEDEACIRAGRYFFMGSEPKAGQQQHNGAILTSSNVLRNVAASAAAEMGALFLNAKEGVNIHHILQEMGHPQPPTPLQTDNTNLHGIPQGTCKQQISKAIDTSFYRVRDREKQH